MDDDQLKLVLNTISEEIKDVKKQNSLHYLKMSIMIFINNFLTALCLYFIISKG